MADLDSRLRDLGAGVDFPATPPIATQVSRDLMEGSGPRRRAHRAPPLRVALAVTAALLLLAAVATAAVPSARHAVLDFLGLPGATVQRISRLPENARAKQDRRLGRSMSLTAAKRSLSFSPLLPTGIGQPSGVFVRSGVPGGALTLTYAPTPGLPPSRFTGVGLLIDELDGHFAPGFIGKFVPPGAKIERFGIEGNYAIWIEGLHLFTFKAADHTFHRGRSRLASNCLLVQRGDVMVRIEAHLDKATATGIARSLRRR
jgi:hypothetical protein